MKHGLILDGCIYRLDLPPTQDASHHQDYYICSRESRTKPSFVTGILGGWVGRSKFIDVFVVFCQGKLDRLEASQRSRSNLTAHAASYQASWY